MVEVACVAILLENESTWYTRTKRGKPIIFQPDMSIGNKILVAEILEELNLYQHLAYESLTHEPTASEIFAATRTSKPIRPPKEKKK
jgi:hypothetical protein